MDKKTSFFLTLYMTILFTAVFTVVGGWIQGFDMKALPLQILLGFVLGFTVGTVIPVGEVGAAIASKICEPGSKGFTFIMFQVIILIMCIFMCPLMTIVFGSIIGGAPVAAVLPACYSMFVPFYIIGSLIVQFVGEKISELAFKTAHPGGK